MLTIVHVHQIMFVACHGIQCETHTQYRFSHHPFVSIGHLTLHNKNSFDFMYVKVHLDKYWALLMLYYGLNLCLNLIL